MGEYISRDAAIKALSHGDGCGHVCKHSIERIPAADVVEMRHGKWVWDGGEDMHYYCSICLHNAYGCTVEILDGKYRYCPNCGAVMDGGQDDAG